MSTTAIRAEKLSKQYHIGRLQQSFDRLGDAVMAVVTAPVRRAGKLLRGQATGAAELDETIWALQDISFEIKHGEVVGIVGRNGAGKSTLLKILSRITEPTQGYADIYGRVGSLLEVGTGFHPELTGRENVYLNGAILGMKREEIGRKFDEIVAFAEIEKFIDTPVKHYSSGMYVRLAFAVAAHLEPEILLVDEVLAVGDVAFQKKCLGKMDDVAQQGRTVLFVSHNMGLMQMLCQRGIFLQDGKIAVDGPIFEAVDAYLASFQLLQSQDLAQRTDRQGEGKVKVLRIEAIGQGGILSSPLKTGSPARFLFHTNAVLPDMACNFHLYHATGQAVASFDGEVAGPEDQQDPSLGTTFICEIDSLLLRAGRYYIDVVLIGDNSLQDFVQSAFTFDVGEGDLNGRPYQTNNKFHVAMPHRWRYPPLS